MAKHRSLSNALLTPERMAFIKGQEPTLAEPLDHVPSTDKATIDTVTQLPSPESAMTSTIETSNPPTEPTGYDTRAAATVHDDDEAFRVAITTRLKPRTAEALRRAHLEQKLNRRQPATQQEIIEEAVQRWLREHAFIA